MFTLSQHIGLASLSASVLECWSGLLKTRGFYYNVIIIILNLVICFLSYDWNDIADWACILRMSSSDFKINFQSGIRCLVLAVTLSN